MERGQEIETGRRYRTLLWLLCHVTVNPYTALKWNKLVQKKGL